MTKIEASGLVGALEQTWATIPQRHEDVPDVVVTLGAGSMGAAPGTLKLSHFAAGRWNGSALTDETREAYAAELGGALTAWRRSEGMALTPAGGDEDDTESDGEAGDEDQDEKKPKNGYALVCGCETPRRIRVAATVAELGPITCGLCGEDFTTPPEE